MKTGNVEVISYVWNAVCLSYHTSESEVIMDVDCVDGSSYLGRPEIPARRPNSVMPSLNEPITLYAIVFNILNRAEPKMNPASSR
jgi:hypothetical protein